jgi:hypothetical protein
MRWGLTCYKDLMLTERHYRRKQQSAVEKAEAWEAGESRKQVSTGSHTSLGISQTTRDSLFFTAPTTAVAGSKRNRKTKAARAA